MREIKFRAWDNTFKDMFIPTGISFVDSEVYGNEKYGASFERSLIHVTLMQYTGLHDKHGKEIYEGDIVSCDQAQDLGWKVVGIVHFGIDFRESSGWCDPRIYLDTRPFQKHNGSEFCIFHKQPEVIGNIHENPELLKQRKVEQL